MQVTFRNPVTDQEKALVRAFENEAEVIMALAGPISLSCAEVTRMDSRRLDKVQRRALDAARVRYAALATRIGYELPVSE